MKSLYEIVVAIDPVNVEYILKSSEIMDEYTWYQMRRSGYPEEYYLNRLEKKIREFTENHLVPSNVKVGDGATVCLHTDRHAGTIIKVTAKTVTLQLDKATLSPDFHPEFVVGGFAGHCTNQEDQTYTYERDPEGEIETFRWSEKFQSYGRPGYPRLIKGRHEFYDYNF